jgi:hypothetical protein
VREASASLFFGIVAFAQVRRCGCIGQWRAEQQLLARCGTTAPRALLIAHMIVVIYSRYRHGNEQPSSISDQGALQ